ncbi:MAG TPA: DUF6644 family protein [Steroidobacteraceae bacterium]|nr:DUF6644 family protein [Steroidobacteraceae bacterium]
MHHIHTYYTVRHWADWISATSLSQWLQNAAWFVPTSQSIHIVSLSMVFGSALAIDLRLLGLGRSFRSVADLTRTLVPWIYGGLVVLFITGSFQTITEPTRQFVSPAFWSKMAMIVCVLALTMWLSRSVAADPERWNSIERRPRRARLVAVASLGLWIAIIYCGRFIAYTWTLHV